MATWKRSARAWATLLWIIAGGAIPARAQEQELCPDFKDTIEELPFTDEQGDTCTSKVGSVNRYESPTCRIPGVDYPGGELVYKVKLNQGNEVAFFLDVQGSADLVMALVKRCGDGKSCVGSSTDFIGSGDEEISAARYDPDIYYLYVDSVAGACGSYKLKVSGTNPMPKLKLELAAPKSVFAGNPFTYTLTVSNQGDGDAFGVEITQTLPDGVTMQSGSDCTGNGSRVVCKIGDLKKGQAALPKKIKVLVHPSTRDRLTSTAEATASGGTTALPARDEATTRVDTESDLSIRMASSASSVVAGEHLTYVFTLHNAGPSDATQVKVIDIPSGKETFLEASSEWVCGPVTEGGIAKVKCEMPRIPAGGKVTPSIKMTVKSSAREPLINRATISAVEKEPACNGKRKCGPNSAAIETLVERKTDLTIVKTGPIEPVGVGDVFSYILTVENKGPSDSSGATVTDCLPKNLFYVEKDSRCLSSTNNASCVGVPVTCKIGPLDSGHHSSVTIGARTDPALLPTTLFNKADLQANENDPTGANESNTVATEFKVKAVLRVLSKTAKRVAEPGGAADSICPGENLLYTIKIVNDGPSNSSGGTICDKFSDGLSFVSSPDGCTDAGSGPCTVTCPVPPLAANDPVPHSFRIVALPTGAKTSVNNEASVTGDDDPHPSGESKSVTTTILRDLAVTLSASKGLVVTGEPLTYRVSVTNRGPEAKDVKVRLELPGSPSSNEDCTLPDKCTVEDCILGLGDIPKGGTRTRDACVAAPSSSGNFTAVASFVNPDPCNQTDNNSSEITTTVADADDVDLTLTMMADKETVVVGDLLSYTIQAVNQGPAATLPPIRVVVKLPAAKFESAQPDLDCSEPEQGSDPEQVTVTCLLDPLPAGYPSIVVAMKVVEPTPPAVRAPLTSTATVGAVSNGPDSPTDPDSGDNEASVETPFLPGPLLLPFFEVDGGLEEVTTLFAVRNASAGSVNVQYDVAVTSLEPPVKIPLDPPSLAGKATDTVNLGEVIELAGDEPKRGYVAISSDSPDALGGDFFRIDSSKRTASGELLVSADTSRIPRELCREWSVRFLNGGPLKASTEFLFFAPGNSGVTPVATGTVFNEKGQVVQEISIKNPEESFRITSLDKFDHDLPLLVGSGSIEWTFREGLVGNVSSVYKEEGNDSVAVPGFCRRLSPEENPDPQPASLIVPYFEIAEVDSPTLSKATTIFAVRNESEDPVDVKYTYYDRAGNKLSLLDHTASLPGHAVNTVNLRDLRDELGPVTMGFITMEQVVDTVTPPDAKVLSGDFTYVDRESHLASGSAVVDSARLCQHWDVRFLEGGSRATDLIFYIPGDTSAPPQGVAYREDDAPPASPVSVSIPAGWLSFTAFQLPVAELDPQLSGNGSIEWDLGAKGYVAALFTEEGHFSVLVPGICRDGNSSE